MLMASGQVGIWMGWQMDVYGFGLGGKWMCKDLVVKCMSRGYDGMVSTWVEIWMVSGRVGI